MKRRITLITLALLLNGSLIHLSHAHYPNISELAIQCQDSATYLRQLVQMRSKDRCSGDVESVASSLESAGKRLRLDNSKRILVSVRYAALELNEIQKKRAYCHHYSSLITPVLDRVKNMGNDVERLTQSIKAYMSS